jgi:hypothetical protein
MWTLREMGGGELSGDDDDDQSDERKMTWGGTWRSRNYFVEWEHATRGPLEEYSMGRTKLTHTQRFEDK